MKTIVKSGVDLARVHAGRFRIVSYGELRAKATEVAGKILEKYRNVPEGIVVAPILGGGGLPARLIVDALLPFGLVKAVVPCQIRRYTGMEGDGAAELLLKLAADRVKGRTVIGVDDLVDGGQTLEAFVEHAGAVGARVVETAVIYAKPHSTFVPDYVAEDGVLHWLVLPGEEHAFMQELAGSENDVESLGAQEQARYFEELGIDAAIVNQRLKL